MTGPLAPEVLVPRLGESLVDQGLLTPSDLKRALAYQKERGEQGQRILLGQALIDLGLIGRSKLDAAITQQISQLQEALHQSNLFLEQRVQERTAELQEALDKLTELNRLKNDFISNVSHELRTPLAHMVGYIDLLLAEALGSLSNEQRQALTVLEKSYRRLNSLIDNLLFMAFDTAESLHLETGPVNLGELFAIVIKQVQSKAQAAGIQVTSSLPPDLPPIQADINKIEWVLGQLLDNAVKFNQSGGRAHLRAELDARRVQIAVADTGIGIPSEKIDEIFEPFHQLDSSSTRKAGGAGIGLTLVKRIVEAHGSKLQIETHAGQGSRFSFSLPISQGKL
ncbi:MAG: ATP-binding protein [Chloroflexi bacterium]|nr:ATP-binding protein [Chloroflexota bacterium]